MKTPRFSVLVGAPLAIALFTSACDGNGTIEKAPLTSLPSNADLAELSASQKKTLCNDTVSYLSDVLGTAAQCPWYGFSAAEFHAQQSTQVTDVELQTFCASNRERCQREVEPLEGECEISNECHVTIAEFSDCVVDWKAFMVEYEKNVPACETLTRNSALGYASIMSFTSPACVAAQKKCPQIDLVDDMMGMMGMMK